MPTRKRTEIARALGTRIRAFREKVGITQETLAWESDLAKSYLSQVEAGQRIPSVPAIFALAERLGVTGSEILDFHLRRDHKKDAAPQKKLRPRRSRR